MEYELKIVPEEKVGVVKIREDSQFNKVSAEKVIVNENVTARVFGRVNNIVVKKGAKLFLHGIISGTVENTGGEIFIYSK